MFFSFQLKNTKPLTHKETAAIRQVLDDYSRTPNGEWLRTFPYMRFEFRWCPAFNTENGIIGAFLWTHPWTIYLMPEQVQTKKSTWPRYITDSVIHELRHAWQFRKNPLLYILCALPILRQFTIEKDATKIGKEAMRINLETIGWHDHQEWKERFGEKGFSDN